ncbi:hypothetical protein J5X84_06900 [Streptosporangiaceae bacterium NEAU-GS5]|nr:hypothetical protein [Streptosporangiaceae bacterium NEAU-GS5]
MSQISAMLVAWGASWLAGHVGLDQVVDRVEAAVGPQLVHDPAGDGDVPLRAFLAALRAEGLTAFRLALPAPGDPLGLTGPPPFNVAALDAGQAVVAVRAGGCAGLVPEEDQRGSSYRGVRWTLYEAAEREPYIPDLAEAERELTRAMLAATDALTSVDGPAQGFPTLPEPDQTLAPGYPGRAVRVGALAARLALALRLAEERGLTVAQVSTRSEALRDLDRAVRRARVAAHHALSDSSDLTRP